MSHTVIAALIENQSAGQHTEADEYSWGSVMQEVPFDLGLGNWKDLKWTERKGGHHEQTEKSHKNGTVTVRDQKLGHIFDLTSDTSDTFSARLC